MSVDSVTPTRMNLLQRKAQVKLARDGVGLLKGKRDALMQELITRARELRDERNKLHERGRAAEAEIAMARAVRGLPELKSATVGMRRGLNLEVRTEKVWGLPLGAIDKQDIVRAPNRRPVSLVDTSAHVQEATETAEEMLEQLLVCAPLERNLQIIGEEVKKVSRRINALEEHLIPRLLREMRFIQDTLDEREREDVFRLKRIKGKKAQEKKEKEAARKAAEAQELGDTSPKISDVEHKTEPAPAPEPEPATPTAPEATDSPATESAGGDLPPAPKPSETPTPPFGATPETPLAPEEPTEADQNAHPEPERQEPPKALDDSSDSSDSDSDDEEE